MLDRHKHSDLKLLAEFTHLVAGHHIRWNQNHNNNFVKDLMIMVVRNKLPQHVKGCIFDALNRSAIDLNIHTTYDSIKDVMMRVKYSNSANIVHLKFEDFDKKYLQPFESLPRKLYIHKDGEKFTTKERAERSAKNAARVRVGNCAECRNVCESVWIECTPTLLNAFKLPQFSQQNLPHMEQVHYSTEADHSFNIINRDLNSDLSDISSWIENDREVLIVDVWMDEHNVISINEQLALPRSERSYAFKTLQSNLEEGEKLEVISIRKLGEAHSSRWLSKKRDEHYFIRKNYPMHHFFNQNKSNNKGKCMRLQPYKSEEYSRSPYGHGR